MSRIGIRHALVPLLLLGVVLPTQGASMELAPLEIVEFVPMVIDVDLLGGDCIRLAQCLENVTVYHVQDLLIATDSHSFVHFMDDEGEKPDCFFLQLENVGSVFAVLGSYPGRDVLESAFQTVNVASDMVYFDPYACISIDSVWAYVPTIDLESARHVYQDIAPGPIYYNTY